MEIKLHDNTRNSIYIFVETKVVSAPLVENSQNWADVPNIPLLKPCKQQNQ